MQQNQKKKKMPFNPEILKNEKWYLYNWLLLDRSCISIKMSFQCIKLRALVIRQLIAILILCGMPIRMDTSFLFYELLYNISYLFVTYTTYIRAYNLH